MKDDVTEVIVTLLADVEMVIQGGRLAKGEGPASSKGRSSGFSSSNSDPSTTLVETPGDS